MAKTIKATEIVPGKMYLARRMVSKHDQDWQPVIINCTAEPGWLRGYVDVQPTNSNRSGFTGFASGNFVEDGAATKFSVIRKGAEDAWEFGDAYSGFNLIHMPPGWAKSRLDIINAKIAALQDSRIFLESIK